MKERKTRYYSSFSDDFEQTANQENTLPEGYKWIRTGFWAKVTSALLYVLALVLGGLYCKLFLHLKIKGRNNLKGIKGGFFVYGNHTQPIGDVFLPALSTFPKRIYTVVSTANYGIPVIGKLLPYLGALPVTDTLHGIKELGSAINHRIKQGNPIVIYPEAHVWEYYTDIRPFSDTSFRYPARLDKPVFSMTVTYKRSKIFKRPKTEVYLDGPFYPHGETVREKTKSLHEQIYNAMKERAKESDAYYIEYQFLEEN